jgi:RNA polymerase sigma factor FliA
MRGYASASACACIRERDHLIVEYAPMARRIALRVARRVPDWVCSDDLVAAAMIGLAEAADRFDGTRGEPFVAFATKRIRGAVLDEMRRGDLMPRRARSAARHVSQTVRDLEQQLGRPAEDEEVAAALGVELDVYREDLEMLTHVGLVELQPEERGAARGDDPEQQMQTAELRQRVRDALERIPGRDALILSLYYIEELSYAEVGAILGVTESRVCQLHGRALLRLRAELDDAGDEVTDG